MTPKIRDEPGAAHLAKTIPPVSSFLRDGPSNRIAGIAFLKNEARNFPIVGSGWVLQYDRQLWLA